LLGPPAKIRFVNERPAFADLKGKLVARRFLCAGEPATARFGDGEAGPIPSYELEIEQPNGDCRRYQVARVL